MKSNQSYEIVWVYSYYTHISVHNLFRGGNNLLIQKQARPYSQWKFIDERAFALHWSMYACLEKMKRFLNEATLMTRVIKFIKAEMT
jgi:hypothetical protein